MEFREFKAKTVEEAITAASMELGVASADLDYEIIEKGTSGFLGIGAKPAVIKAKKKDSFLEFISRVVSPYKSNIPILPAKDSLTWFIVWKA